MNATACEAPTCVDLRVIAGDRYRIGHDPCHDHHHVPRRCWDPWLLTIPCRGNVIIFPHGGDLLAVELDNHPGLAKRLTALPGVVLHQAGDHERTYLFPAHLFDQVADIVKPRRRRRLTEEQRQAAAERLARVRPGRGACPASPANPL